MHHTLNLSSTQYLSENIVHTEVVIREDVFHMWFLTVGEPPAPHEAKMCV
jgi:hypothetical protein